MFLRCLIDDWAKSIRAPFADPDNSEPGLSGIYRPVAMLTFAFNWYLGGTNVFGYHLVNIGIHCLTSGLLFLYDPQFDAYTEHDRPIPGE